MSSWGMPGPGGSMGKCAVCGAPFAVEVLMGKTVTPFRVGFIDAQLYCHEGCRDTISTALEKASEEVRDIDAAIKLRELLPDESPIGNALTGYIKELQA